MDDCFRLKCPVAFYVTNISYETVSCSFNRKFPGIVNLLSMIRVKMYLFFFQFFSIFFEIHRLYKRHLWTSNSLASTVLKFQLCFYSLNDFGNLNNFQNKFIFRNVLWLTRIYSRGPYSTHVWPHLVYFEILKSLCCSTSCLYMYLVGTRGKNIRTTFKTNRCSLSTKIVEFNACPWK